MGATVSLCSSGATPGCFEGQTRFGMSTNEVKSLPQRDPSTPWLACGALAQRGQAHVPQLGRHGIWSLLQSHRR